MRAPYGPWQLFGLRGMAGGATTLRLGLLTWDSPVCPTLSLTIQGQALRGLRTGFDRLRANGFGRGACGGVWGMRWGTETPRARAPLDSCLRRNDARGGVREGREVVCVGVGALRQAQGERIWEARVRWGVGDAMGDGDAPRRAPALGSRESGNDDWGCGGMRWREGLVSGWGPALAGGRFANRPYDRGGAHEGEGDAGAAWSWGAPSHRLRANGFGRGACGGEWGMRWGEGDAPRLAPLDSFLRRNDARGGVREGREVGTSPRLAPALVSARAGTTMGGVVGCVGARGSGQGGGPLSRAGGSRTAPTTGVGRTRAGVMRGLLVVEAPSTDSGRTGLGGARAVGCGGCDGGQGCPAPRTCPGFPLSRERRVAGAVRRYQRGRDSPVRANVEPRAWETAHS